jgi:branched-chain amino acid transport system permease protein
MVISATFIIGAALAAVAGVMWAANYGTVQHSMGFLPGPEGLHGGGAGRHRQPGRRGGRRHAAGPDRGLGPGYLGVLTGGVLGSHYADIFAFVVLILVLTLRPQGLLGERVATAPEEATMKNKLSSS